MWPSAGIKNIKKRMLLTLKPDMKNLLLLILSWLVAMQAPVTLRAQPAVVGTFQGFDASYSASTYVTLTDERDSRPYTVAKIGRNWIMTQNLNYQKGLVWCARPNQPSSRYGGAIVELMGHFWCPGGHGADVSSSTQASCATWGALYSWETAMTVDGKWSDDSHDFVYWVEPVYNDNKPASNTNNNGRGAAGHGICPAGWHVPTDAEWGEVFTALEDGATGDDTGYNYNGKTAGHRAKAQSTCPTQFSDICVNDKKAAWFDLPVPDTTAAPTLQLIPAGLRRFDGLAFEGRGLKAALWSSSAYSDGAAWLRRVNHDSGYVFRYATSRSTGASIRCIKPVDDEQ
jgi:uncharacterized protein (TIGR02145 family)